jgi:hypothetical protein
MDTCGRNTFDTLCSTWRDQLKTPFEGPHIKKDNDTVDLLLSNLLEDIWLQCERLFKQSEISAANMKFTTDNFCLHVMNQLISTHNQLYDIKRKSQKNAALCQETLYNITYCTDKTLSIHGFTELSNQDVSKMPIEHEKNSRQLVRPGHFYLHQNHQSSKCLDENSAKEDSEHGSNKIEITGNIPMSHRLVILKPVKYKSKNALPFFLDERNSSFSVLRLLPKRIRPSNYAKKGFAL